MTSKHDIPKVHVFRAGNDRHWVVLTSPVLSKTVAESVARKIRVYLRRREVAERGT